MDLMCIGCVRDAVGKEPGVELHEDSGSIAAAIKVWYGLDGNGVGGMLHIQLDDFNLEDHHVVSIAEQGWMKEDARRLQADRVAMADAILDGLRPMSEAQRNLTVGLAHGDVSVDRRAQHGWRYNG